MFRNMFRKQFPKVQDALDTCPRVSITNSMGIDGGGSAVDRYCLKKTSLGGLGLRVCPERSCWIA
jgi:hypothetical protein